MKSAPAKLVKECIALNSALRAELVPMRTRCRMIWLFALALSAIRFPKCIRFLGKIGIMRIPRNGANTPKQERIYSDDKRNSPNGRGATGVR